MEQTKKKKEIIRTQIYWSLIVKRKPFFDIDKIIKTGNAERINHRHLNRLNFKMFLGASVDGTIKPVQISVCKQANGIE